MLLFLGFILILFWCIFRLRRQPGVIAFLHPYCEQGGGGEVVLWKAVTALRERITRQHEYDSIRIYTTVMDSATLEKAKKTIHERFGFDMNARENVDLVKFVHIRTLLEPKWYPRFTLFGQFLGGLIVSLECLLRLNPMVLIDSTGIPGALPVFRLIGGSKVLVYMHYPTITTNMIQRVNRGEEMYNNAAFIARNPWLSAMKYYYYLLFSYVYQLCGFCATKVWVNGTFTKRHIEQLWPKSDITLCYPPVALHKFFALATQAENLFEESNRVNILSLGQFRPEKNHRSQLETLKLLKQKSNGIKYCLNMLGGVRNVDDQKVVDELRECAERLELIEGTDFNLVCNAPMERLAELLTESMFGIHTMIDEHFGIALVEMLAARIIVVAHESGGPLFDIIGEQRDAVGFLGKDAEDYANTIIDVMERSREERDSIRKSASQKANDFSEESFKRTIIECVENERVWH